MATKSTLKLSARQFLFGLLPWLALALFAWVVYAGASSSPVVWLNRNLQNLTRWPSQDSEVNIDQTGLSNYQRHEAVDKAQKLLSGHWRAARITGQVSSSRHLLLLNLGSDNGVKLGQSVVVNGNFVGVIWQVSVSKSTAILFGDPDFSVAAVAVGSKSDGLVETKNGGLVFDHVLNHPNIQDKELMTSGQGAVVPAGLPIGRVTDQISTSPNDESTWGVEYPGASGQIWAAVLGGE